MTRNEHLEWCKKRAMEYIDNGNLDDAFSSMMSDLSKHDETRNHSAIKLGMSLLMSGFLSNVEEMRKFINGFN